MCAIFTNFAASAWNIKTTINLHHQNTPIQHTLRGKSWLNHQKYLPPLCSSHLQNMKHTHQKLVHSKEFSFSLNLPVSYFYVSINILFVCCWFNKNQTQMKFIPEYLKVRTQVDTHIFPTVCSICIFVYQNMDLDHQFTTLKADVYEAASINSEWKCATLASALPTDRIYT